MAAAMAVEKDLAALRGNTATDGALHPRAGVSQLLAALAKSAESQRVVLAPDQTGAFVGGGLHQRTTR